MCHPSDIEVTSFLFPLANTYYQINSLTNQESEGWRYCVSNSRCGASVAWGSVDWPWTWTTVVSSMSTACHPSNFEGATLFFLLPPFNTKNTEHARWHAPYDGSENGNGCALIHETTWCWICSMPLWLSGRSGGRLHKWWLSLSASRPSMRRNLKISPSLQHVFQLHIGIFFMYEYCTIYNLKYYSYLSSNSTSTYLTLTGIRRSRVMFSQTFSALPTLKWEKQRNNPALECHFMCKIHFPYWCR